MTSTVIFGLTVVGYSTWAASQNPVIAKNIAEEESRTEPIPPIRGQITDRRGVALAISVPYLRASMVPNEVRNGLAKHNTELETQREKAKESGQDISAFPPPVSEDAWVQSVTDFLATYAVKGSQPPTFDQVRAKLVAPTGSQQEKEIFTGLRPEAKKVLEDGQKAGNLLLPGLMLKSRTERVYPDELLARQVVGIVDTEQKGIEGIEKQMNDVLTGTPGSRPARQGTWRTSAPGTVENEIAAIDGSAVKLSLDQRIQHATERELQQAMERFNAKSASAVVLHVPTGDVVAMANVPTVGPHDRSNDSLEFRRNRAITDMFEHGSVNKVVTLAGGIEEGLISANSTFQVPDEITIGKRTYHDATDHKEETWSVKEIITRSSNVGTIKMGQALGPQRLHTYMEKFGVGQPTGIGFIGESSGRIADVASWNEASLPTISIGQGVSTTLLQIAEMYAVIAADGVKIPPRLISATIGPDGVETPVEQGVATQVVSARTADKVTDILVDVVDGAHGTGKAAAVPGYDVAAKTGTAQKPDLVHGGYLKGAYIASMAGFAPAKHPEFVVAVHLDEPTPYEGSKSAAPTFSAIMAQALSLQGVAPTRAVVNAVPQQSTNDDDMASPDNDESTSPSSRETENQDEQSSDE
ncbi:penicillin-binding protein 2 [Stomatohabitans albus]|uniref:peptidoglycan D,D-transpeptidase FtsI family protein n=1 Tax=Stomatohabitans albus TaxID=3110766 RepID=UPI00300D47FF